MKTFTPSVRTWFPDEIANTLRAVAMSNSDIADAIDTPEMALYRRGFDAAIAAIAAGFGVDCPRRNGTQIEVRCD